MIPSTPVWAGSPPRDDEADDAGGERLACLPCGNGDDGAAMRQRPSWDLESRLAAAGAPVVFGFDEVGRGALAGPVMVGCAAIRSSRLLPVPPSIPDHLADSKMLTEREREALFDPLSGFVDVWAVGSASNKEIDEAGITHALGLAALRALVACEERLMGWSAGSDTCTDADAADGQRENFRGPAATLSAAAGILDGPYDYISRAAGAMDAPAVPVLPRITTKVKADAGCAIVSAASDLAKVTRDRLMEELAGRPGYAVYGWASNKGYGTSAHRAAIAAYGPSDLHRLTWHLV